jgi:hypothetical protein
MRRQEHAHDQPRRSKLNLPTIVERATGPRLGMNSHLIGRQLQALLDTRLRKAR